MYLKEQKMKEEWELSLLLLRWIKHDSANQLGFKFNWVSLKNFGGCLLQQISTYHNKMTPTPPQHGSCEKPSKR